MRLIKRKDIKWVAVRSNFRYPWVLLGWPISATYSRWGVSKDQPFLEKSRIQDHPTLRIKLPWGPDPEECHGKKPLRACLYLRWFGFLWFWRAS